VSMTWRATSARPYLPAGKAADYKSKSTIEKEEKLAAKEEEHRAKHAKKHADKHG